MTTESIARHTPPPASSHGLTVEVDDGITFLLEQLYRFGLFILIDSAFPSMQ